MYRTVDSNIWDDTWFTDLTPDAKLLFLYLFTNRRTTPCGVFEITIRAMSFETGLSTEQIQTALNLLAPKVIWYAETQVIWVRNFYKRQRANSNERFASAARKALDAFPMAIQSDVVAYYPELIPPLSHPYPIAMPGGREGGNETEQNRTEQEQKIARTDTHEGMDAPAREGTHEAEQAAAFAALPSAASKIPPGTKVAARPDAPPHHSPARALPNADDPAAPAAYQAVAGAYPDREGGIRPNDTVAYEAFLIHAPKGEWANVTTGARHYANAVRAGTVKYAYELENWLERQEWRRWQAAPVKAPVVWGPMAPSGGLPPRPLLNGPIS